MSSVLERSLGILELLSEEGASLPVTTIANRLNIPASAAHRLLGELARFGYVRQAQVMGDYQLTIKLAALGLAFLRHTGITDVAQPILDRLAGTTRELVRLSVLDGDSLVWVAVAQGAISGLRYDPGQEQGLEVHLASSANGQAYLSTLTDDQALMRVAAQGFEPTSPQPGTKAPMTPTQLLALLAETRKRGFSVAIDSYIQGMAAMATVVRRAQTGDVIGTLSIAGPAARLRQAQMKQFNEALQNAANELGQASHASHFFNNRADPSGSNRNKKESGSLARAR